MKKIWTYILTKAKQRFLARGMGFDAGEMSFRLFKGLKIKEVTVSAYRGQVSLRMENVGLRFNLVRLLFQKLPDRLDVPFAELTIRWSDQEWRMPIKNITARTSRSGKSINLAAGSPSIELFHAQLLPIPLRLSIPALDLTWRQTDDGLIMEQTLQGSFPALNFTIHSQFQTGPYALFTCSLETADFIPDDIAGSFPVFTGSDAHPWRSSGSDAHPWRSSGSLRFAARFTVDPANPRRHSFQANLLRKDFSFAGQGPLDLGYLKDPFLHVIRGHGLPRQAPGGQEEQSPPRTEILLGKDDPQFASLDTISDMLIKVIISREDPRFYTHHGFDEQLFGYALVTDLREKKAARGGSTITMQLARNLFLHHGKTLGRKLEEVILAWLIEDIYRIPKDRILEIYLNIIEFAPDIYGIRPACLFYFDTTPDRITLTQSLVLSYIIPRPRHFAEALKGRSPVLPARLGQHVHRAGRALRRKGLIGEEEYKGIGAGIRFAGALGEIQFVR